MADFPFYILFNIIWLGDYERLCAMEPRLRLQRLPPPAGLEPKTARSVDQLFAY